MVSEHSTNQNLTSSQTKLDMMAGLSSFSRLVREMKRESVTEAKIEPRSSDSTSVF